MIVVSFSKQTTDTLGNYCLIWIKNKSLKSHRIVAKYFNKLKKVVNLVHDFLKLLTQIELDFACGKCGRKE